MERLLLGQTVSAETVLPPRKIWGVSLRDGPRGRLRACLFYALGLLLVSITIHRERFGIPLELDAPVVAVMGVLVLLVSPRAVFRIWAYPLILPMVGFVLTGYASCLANSGDLGEVARSGSSLFDVCLRQSAVLTYRAIMFYVVVFAASLLPEMRRKPPVIMLGLLLVQTLGSLAFLPLYPNPVSELVIRGDQFGEGSLALMGTFLEPNLFGIFAVTTVVLWIPLALCVSEKRALARSLACMQIGIVAVYMSYTRSAWLALIGVYCVLAAVVFAGFKVGGHHRRRIILIVGAMVALGFALAVVVSRSLHGEEASAAMVERSSQLVEEASRLVDEASGAPLENSSQILEGLSGSGGSRLQIWSIALEEWARKPILGWGLLSFEPTTIYPTGGWLYGSLVQTLHDTGLLGVLFMLWLCAGVAVHTWRSYRTVDAEVDRAIALGYLASLAALFFASQFSSFFWGGLTWVLFGLAVGYNGLAPEGHPGNGAPLEGTESLIEGAIPGQGGDTRSTAVQTGHGRPTRTPSIQPPLPG